MIKIASLMAWISGVGFGLPCIYGIWNMWKGKGIPYLLGFPCYGFGPFEKIGIQTTIPLLFAFLIVCCLECVVGYMLWNLNKSGALLSFVNIVLELFFFFGFDLPFGPPLMMIRTLFVILSWSSFNH